jgi:hypothetical protein
MPPCHIRGNSLPTLEGTRKTIHALLKIIRREFQGSSGVEPRMVSRISETRRIEIVSPVEGDTELTEATQ